MLLGNGIPLATLDATTALASDILGADLACREIRRRTLRSLAESAPACRAAT